MAQHIQGSCLCSKVAGCMLVASTQWVKFGHPRLCAADFAGQLLQAVRVEMDMGRCGHSLFFLLTSCASITGGLDIVFGITC